MAEIKVSRVGATTFHVEVTEGATKTVHTVTASAQEIQRYGGGASPERLITASFEFLLEREPKESILCSFKLPLIEHYFPEYPAEIRTRLA